MQMQAYLNLPSIRSNYPTQVKCSKAKMRQVTIRNANVKEGLGAGGLVLLAHFTL